MQKLTIAGLITTGFIALAAMAPNQAQAVPLASTTGSPAAVGGSAGNPDISIQQVRLVCQRVWRCGRYGCGWRRSCYRTQGYVGPYYNYYAPRYSYRQRPGVRHRHCNWHHGRRHCSWR